MRKFIPNTQTVNQDRSYFIDSGVFVKRDMIITRGANEASILAILDHPLIQKYIKSYEEDDTHVLESEFFNGETLENLRFSREDEKKIVSQLFDVFAYMVSIGVVHGDIHVSNVLYDGFTIKIIDWETAYFGDTLADLLGPPSGHALVADCGIVNVVNFVRGNLF